MASEKSFGKTEVKLHEGPDGSTPLDPEEIDGLLPTHIVTRGELDQFEQQNILDATLWALSRRHNDALTERFIRNLHKRMFANVWKWAGNFRKTGKNIGVDAYQIPVALRELIEDSTTWIEREEMSWDEIGARFHHRLVAIHLFPNGNGRHARLMTDVLMKAHGQELFTWGSESIDRIGDVRSRYISALRSADDHDIKPLIRFVRS